MRSKDLYIIFWGVGFLQYVRTHDSCTCVLKLLSLHFPVGLVWETRPEKVPLTLQQYVRTVLGLRPEVCRTSDLDLDLNFKIDLDCFSGRTGLCVSHKNAVLVCQGQR